MMLFLFQQHREEGEQPQGGCLLDLDCFLLQSDWMKQMRRTEMTVGSKIARQRARLNFRR